MKTLILLVIVIGLSGCSTFQPVSDQPQAWVSRRVGMSDNIYFCNSSPVPKCTEAKFDSGSRNFEKPDVRF